MGRGFKPRPLNKIIINKKLSTSVTQRLPFVLTKHPNIPPLQLHIRPISSPPPHFIYILSKAPASVGWFERESIVIYLGIQKLWCYRGNSSPTSGFRSTDIAENSSLVVHTLASFSSSFSPQLITCFRQWHRLLDARLSKLLI